MKMAVKSAKNKSIGNATAMGAAAPQCARFSGDHEHQG